MIPSGINRQFNRQFNLKNRIFPIPLSKIFHIFNRFLIRAGAILTITYVRSIFITDQSEFMEHFQYGKHIGKILDIKNTQQCPQAQKPIFLGLGSDKSGNPVPILENFENSSSLLTEFLCRMGQTLFQTSS